MEISLEHALQMLKTAVCDDVQHSSYFIIFRFSTYFDFNFNRLAQKIHIPPGSMHFFLHPEFIKTMQTVSCFRFLSQYFVGFL